MKNMSFYGMTLYRNREKKMSMFDEFATKFKNSDGSEVLWKIHNLCNQVCTYTYWIKLNTINNIIVINVLKLSIFHQVTHEMKKWRTCSNCTADIQIKFQNCCASSNLNSLRSVEQAPNWFCPSIPFLTQHSCFFLLFDNFVCHNES